MNHLAALDTKVVPNLTKCHISNLIFMDAQISIDGKVHGSIPARQLQLWHRWLHAQARELQLGH
jgi:hypothetical protein